MNTNLSGLAIIGELVSCGLGYILLDEVGLVVAKKDCTPSLIRLASAPSQNTHLEAFLVQFYHVTPSITSIWVSASIRTRLKRRKRSLYATNLTVLAFAVDLELQ